MKIGRLYDPPDGDQRILVDRLWPRGIRKDDPRVGHWLPKVAPSPDLRRWYGHRPERYAEFAVRYREELRTPEGAVALAELRELIAQAPTTLVTATHDLDASQLPILAEVLDSGDDD